MAPPTRSERFVQKAETALLAAIEIYNKPAFPYREETFAILAINAWELLLKARLLHLNSNDPKCLHVYETRTNKKGRQLKKKYLKRNRAGQCHTLGLGAALVALEKAKSAPTAAVRRNLDALTEIRDGAVHYIVAGPMLAKQAFEVGTATVANFIAQARDWFGLDLSRHHLFLMPIGFVAPDEANAVVATSDEALLVKYISMLMQEDGSEGDGPYHVALTLQVKMKRSAAEGAAKVVITDDPDATPIFLKEEDFKKKYPWDYDKLTAKLRERYSDFKITKKYHALRRPLAKDSKFSMARYLDPDNPKSGKKEIL